MELHSLQSKASGLLAGAFMLLSLPNVGAQSTNSTVPVPGWGIALLVMLSIMAAFVLAVIIFLPLWCRKTENDCQDGISFYSPHTLCKPIEPCNVQCVERPAEKQN